MDEPQLQAINDMGTRQLKSMSRMVDNLLDMARIRLDKFGAEAGARRDP